MKTIGITGGVLGILFSLVCELFAITDDAYSFGNIWFLGVLSGILAIIGISKLNKKFAAPMVVVSCILGIIGISYFYILPAILSITPLVKRRTK